MMVRLVCRMLKYRKMSKNLNSLLGIQSYVHSVADMVSCDRLEEFRHSGRKDVDDWASTFRSVEVAGVKCRGRKIRFLLYWIGIQH